MSIFQHTLLKKEASGHELVAGGDSGYIEMDGLYGGTLRLSGESSE